MVKFCNILYLLKICAKIYFKAMMYVTTLKKTVKLEIILLPFFLAAAHSNPCVLPCIDIEFLILQINECHNVATKLNVVIFNIFRDVTLFVVDFIVLNCYSACYFFLPYQSAFLNKKLLFASFLSSPSGILLKL